MENVIDDSRIIINVMIICLRETIKCPSVRKWNALTMDFVCTLIPLGIKESIALTS